MLQVRLRLGMEQYEIHGRPDGLLPEGAESWFHVYRDLASASPWDFSLDESAFDRLRDECMLYYHRYLLFFQIGEYKLCARDTQRNLGVLDFASKHCDPKLAEALEQYRPYILRMHAMAEALDGIQETGDVERAMAVLARGTESIRALPPIPDNEIFEIEKERSLRSLDDLHRQLDAYLPKSSSSRLQDKLRVAVEVEDYEEAARLRDEIAKLRREDAAAAHEPRSGSA